MDTYISACHNLSISAAICAVKTFIKNSRRHGNIQVVFSVKAFPFTMRTKSVAKML
ncbi:hypothetical protein Pcar_3474 [Syntrophotalea carbinolica DSM 2380]|uniref:Uncharacterized protein n=1 Tax=Syntrophotalea carbinolica (strain DSM 2380 / NBRC 103641 / GraBd1) TaxID=338963 RepID=J9U443_SYNC1|nr:hypothetical protein Pcar_3474 [Syntrophotalea carbinolica DSM 2380]